MYTKDLWKNNILSEDTGQWPATLLKISYFHGYFSFFHTFCNQLPGFTASGTFAVNGLKASIFNNVVKLYIQQKN